MTIRRQLVSFVIVSMALIATQRCFANVYTAKHGSPFDRIPEIVESSGMSEKELELVLDGIETETMRQPFIVTRAKWVEALFRNSRLAVKPDDVFVDWLQAQWLLHNRRDRRLNDFRRKTPAVNVDSRHSSVSMLDPSHTCPDWESVLALGPKGLADRARKRLGTASTDGEMVFLSSVAKVYDAMCDLAVRWADVADGVGAKDCALTLREIAAHEPRTLRQALQLMLLYNCCQEAEGEYVRSQGLFDRLFIDFYRKDVAAGRESRESAKRLIRELFLKFYYQWHPNGNNIEFGGYDSTGASVWNEITEIAFEVHYELNHHTPKLTFRYGSRTPREHLLKVARCLADGRTSIVLLNDDVAKEMFVRRGKVPEDVVNAVLIGCYEPGIQGREVIASMSVWLNMVKPLEAVFNHGMDFAGNLIGVECELPSDYPTFEREYLQQLDAVATKAMAVTRTWESSWYDLNPSPLMSGSFRDCIAAAKDAYSGGCKYNQSGVMCAGLGTVADSLAAVRYLVDEAKLVTMAQLGAILKANWSGHDELRLRARRSPAKWGNNDDRVDVLAKKVHSHLAALINNAPNGHGGTFQAGFWSINHDLSFGSHTAATPDGRKMGDPLSRNNVSTAGCGKEGASALMLSNVKLDQAEAPDGHILDVIMPAGIRSDGRGAERIVAFLETFVKLGGQCIHMNVFDSKTLRDAQKHPDKYLDLQVRVCGWNVRWVDLPKSEQDHFIATAEAQE